MLSLIPLLILSMELFMITAFLGELTAVIEGIWFDCPLDMFLYMLDTSKD